MFESLPRPEDDWIKDAECNKRKEEVQRINFLLGYDMFYPDKGNKPEAKKQSDKFCRPCPVKVACFNAAVENFEQGTWGGDSERERKRLVQQFRTGLLVLPKQPQVQSQDESSNPSEVLDPDRESA